MLLIISYLFLTATFLFLLFLIRKLNRGVAVKNRPKREGIFDVLTKEGTMKNKIPEGFGGFGLTLTNPIPINTHFELEDYLYGLITTTNKEITFSRFGAIMSSNIKNPIDVYDTFVEGDFYKRIYLSPYHKKTSNKIPKGFKEKDFYQKSFTDKYIIPFIVGILTHLLFTSFYLLTSFVYLQEYIFIITFNSLVLAVFSKKFF